MPRPRKPARLDQLEPGGAWYIFWNDGRRDRRASTRTRDRGAAEAQFADFLAKRGRPAQGDDGALTSPSSAVLGTPATLSIAACLAAYLEAFPPEDPSAATAAVHVEHLTGYFGTTTVDAVTKAACKVGYPKWRAEANAQRLERHRKPDPDRKPQKEVAIADGTLRRELATLQAALKLAVADGRLTTAPAVAMPASPRSRDRWLTTAEANALLDACKMKHLKLFVTIALHTGARRGAILDLTWPQVDLVAGRINFNKPGGRQTRKRRPVVSINADLLAALTEAQKKTNGIHVVNWASSKVKSVRTGFAAAVRLAVLPGKGRDAVTPHVLRHTFATWAAQGGVDMHKIAGAMGLTMQRTIEIYAHHHPDYMKETGAAISARLRQA